MMPGSQEQLNQKEKIIQSEASDIKKEMVIESKQQLEQLAHERGINLEAEAANIENDGQKIIDSANNSIGLAAEKIKETKSTFGLQKKLGGISEKAKAIAQEGKEKIKKAVVIGMVAMSVPFTEFNDSGTGKAKDLILDGEIANTNVEKNKESSELISDSTKLKEELALHIRSDEYLAKLKKELNGNEDEAKKYQKIRAENLESVKITPLSLSEMKERFGKDDPPGANVVGYYDPVGHEAFIAHNHKDKYVTTMHELIHASTRQEKDMTEKAKKILVESTKEGDNDYLKKPEERIARKQILDLEMDKLGIKKYGEEFKDEHYEKLMDYFRDGKLSRPAKEFINTTKPEDFKKIFDELAKSEHGESVISV